MVRELSTSRLPVVTICAAIALVTLAVFWPVLGHDYVEWDDPTNVFHNPLLNPPDADSIFYYWSHTHGGLYVPLAHTAWGIIANLIHDASRAPAFDPRVFHAVNLATHVLVALCVFALLRQLVRSDGACAIGAVIFAIHPAQVESVAWISGLKDLLAGLFSAIALWLYMKHAHGASTDGLGAGERHAYDRANGGILPHNTRATLWYLLATMALVCGLLCKPVVITVPLVAFVLDAGLLRRRAVLVVASLAPWAMLALPVAIITARAQPIPDVYAITPPAVRPLVAGDSLAFYIRHVLFPWRLALDYGRSPDVIARTHYAWLWWLVPLAAAVVMVMIRRRAWPVVVGAIVFIIPLLPVLGFRPFGAQIYSSVTDHYLYLPMIGVSLAAAWGASVLPLRGTLVAAIALLAVLGVRSHQQAWQWRNTRTLFTHNLQVNPNSWTSHINLAAEALARDDGVLAEHHTREALRLNAPDQGPIHRNLGLALGQQNRFDEATIALREAIARNPKDPTAHYLLGEALLQMGRFDDAERAFEKSLHLDPTRADAQRALKRLNNSRARQRCTVSRRD